MSDSIPSSEASSHVTSVQEEEFECLVNSLVSLKNEVGPFRSEWNAKHVDGLKRRVMVYWGLKRNELDM